MHIEILVEDSSGKSLLEALLPKILGEQGEPHGWRIHSYKGVGRIPKNWTGTPDPAKRFLLEQLPKLLRGYASTPGIDEIVVVLDTDRENCETFLSELRALAAGCNRIPLFRLAIEEIEAWYLGDRQALLAAYPRANTGILQNYRQDHPCGTWELLADAVEPGGSRAVKKDCRQGIVKHEWAEKIGPLMDPSRNISPSFGKFRDGLRRLIAPSV